MISANKISFSYAKANSFIFREHSFALQKGQVMAILGQNGRGKTTLLKTLLNLLPLSGGRIECSGHSSYVPQNALTPFDYQVRDMVLMGRSRNRGLFTQVTQVDREAADVALERVGITHLADFGFAALSGGQKQMVLMARALVSKPDIVILDEPTSALDYKNQSKILALIKNIAKDNTMVIFTTHCPNHALTVSDRVLIMKNETEYQFGNSEEILTAENLSQLYQIPIYKDVISIDGELQSYVIPLFQSLS